MQSTSLDNASLYGGWGGGACFIQGDFLLLSRPIRPCMIRRGFRRISLFRFPPPHVRFTETRSPTVYEIRPATVFFRQSLNETCSSFSNGQGRTLFTTPTKSGRFFWLGFLLPTVAARSPLFIRIFTRRQNRTSRPS